MTREEVKEIIMMISTAYANWKPMDMTATVNLWSVLFKDYQADDIRKALTNYLMNDTSGFAPVPGQIIASINTGREYLLPEDAWNLVYNGICNSNYHALEEFQKLPPECQKAIGSATNMKEMAVLNYYEMSRSKEQFLKAYKAEVDKRKSHDRTPEGLLEIKQLQIGVNNDEVRQIESVG